MTKSSSISQIMNDKPRDIQKLMTYFNGTTTSASNTLLLFDMLRVIFVLYSKDLLVNVLMLFNLLLALSFPSSFTSTP